MKGVFAREYLSAVSLKSKRLLIVKFFSTFGKRRKNYNEVRIWDSDTVENLYN